jgi:predicted RNA methylase
MNIEQALRDFWQYADDNRGHLTISQIFLSWIRDRIERNEEITPELLFTVCTKRNFDWFGEHSTPQMLVSFIGQLAAQHSAKSVLDPTCGLGLLLHSVAKSTQAQIVHGIEINTEIGNISRAVLSNKATVFAGDALKPHIGLLPQYDMIVANPPFGAIHKMDGLNNTQLFPIELGHQLAVWACNRLSQSGIAIILLQQSFLWQKDGEKALNAIHKAGYRIRALIHVPGGTFSHTSKDAYLTVIEHGVQQQVFVSQLINSPEHQQRLINNYRYKKSDNQLTLGRMCDLATFRGFNYLVNQERIKRLARDLGWSSIRASNVIVSVYSLRKGNIEAPPNCLYIHILRKKATLTLDDIDINSPAYKYYLRLQINQEYADARYLVYWFNHAPIGQATLVGINHYDSQFGPLRINMTALNNMSIYLPPLKTQQQALQGLDNLNRIRAEANDLEATLWSSSNPIDDVVHKIQTINQEDRYQDWLESLPFPLASILWRHHASGASYQERFKTLLHFFEATAAFIATIHLSAFMSDNALWKKTTPILQEKLTQENLSLEIASFGAWKFFVEYLSGRCRKLDDDVRARIYGTSNHNHIEMICHANLLSVLQRANKIRNDNDGHSGVIGNNEAKKYHDELFGLVTTLRGVFGRTWRNYELIQPLQNHYQKGIYTYNVNLLIGVHSNPFEVVKRDSSSPLEHERLYLFDASSQRGLLLQPFMHVIPSPQNHVNACFFLNRNQNNDKRFVSYHFEQESSITIQSLELDAALKHFYSKDEI